MNKKGGLGLLFIVLVIGIVIGIFVARKWLCGI